MYTLALNTVSVSGCVPQVGVIITVLLLLIFYTSSMFLFVGTSLLGLFLSSIFPCMLAYAEDILDYQGMSNISICLTYGLHITFFLYF